MMPFTRSEIAGAAAAHAGGWDVAISQAYGREKRVLADSLTFIPVAAREHALRAFADSRPHLALAFRESPQRLEPERYAAIQQLEHCWGNLLASLGDATRAASPATQIAEQLCRLLGFAPI